MPPTITACQARPAAPAPARPAAPPATAAPTPDFTAFGTGREVALHAQLRQTMYQMDRQNGATLQALDGRMQALLAQPGHDATTRALALLMRSGCAGLLAQLGTDAISNGVRSYKLMKAAVAADPTCQEAVESLGRSALTISRLDFGRRLVVTTGTGMSVKGDARQAVVLLAAFPNDALDQLVRSNLAKLVGDDAARADADARLAAMARTRPRDVAAARAMLGDDAHVAAAASTKASQAGICGR